MLTKPLSFHLNKTLNHADSQNPAIRRLNQSTLTAAVPVNVPGVNGRSNGKAGDRIDALRGRLPFARDHTQSTNPAGSPAWPSTTATPEGAEVEASSGSGGSDQEWRRSLAAESDPIYKESGRSSSRDASGRRTSAAAVPIQGGNNRVSMNDNHHHHHHYSLAEHLSAADSSSPSSVSSFSHANGPNDTSDPRSHTGQAFAGDSFLRSTSASRVPHTSAARNWDVESGSPLGNGAGHASVWSNTTNGESVDTKRLSRSLIPEWQTPARRSLSSSGMSSDRESGRPPMAQRALSINTAALSHVAPHQTFSPSSLRSTSPERIASAFHASSPRIGLGRLPEGEEATGESGGFFAPTNVNTFLSHHHQNQGQRHRSASSAAALQGLNIGAERDRTQGRPPNDQYSRSASLWGGDPLSADLTGSPGSLAFSSNQHTAVNSPNFSRFMTDPLLSPSEFARAGDQQGDPSALQRGYNHGPPFSTLASSARADTFGQTVDEMVGSGSESRRHSMTAAPPVTGQRRAIGFEVTRPHGASRTSSVGRFSGSQAGAGYGLFGGGNLTISEDDLAADFDALRVNLDEAALQQQRGAPTGNRMPSFNAATVGAHASSMPPDYKGFGTSPPTIRGEWPASARPHDDESSSIWSDTIPSPASLRQSFRQSQERHLQEGPSRILSAHAHSFRTNPAHNAFAPGSGAVGGAKRRSIGSSVAFEPFGAGGSGTANKAMKDSVLSDHAIASLVTLGPLAPPSGGPGQQDGSSSLQDLGKGVPLQMLPRDTPLFIVEFKQGRTDLYFRQSQSGAHEMDAIRKGDLVIVEADRGKDLGTVINGSITVDQVQNFLTQQAELAANAAGGQPDGVHPAAMTLSRLTRSVNPKRLFDKAGPADTSLLHAKGQDEERALTLCTTKVNQRGLPMTVVAAEMQWDRRKLTFYYTATQRVDFRDLVKELFRLYKTRIWMCHLSHPSHSGSSSSTSTAAQTQF